MSSDSNDEPSAPILDREAFEQLLAAAYVLQQHSERLSEEYPGLPSALREIQLLPGRRDLDLDSALALIAERLRKVSGATGVSICLVEAGCLRPFACAGIPARVPGGAVAANCLVATERLCNRKAFHSPDADSDVRLDLSMCRHVGIGSLLAVPVVGEDGIAGLIELRSTHTDLFAELEEACHWAAGLVRELLERGLTRSAAVPLSLMAQAELGEESHARGAGNSASAQVPECRVCGALLREGEAFCGHCSMPRSAVAGSEGLQSKWASLWFMQQAKRTLAGGKPDGAMASQSQRYSRVVAAPPDQPLAVSRDQLSAFEATKWPRVPVSEPQPRVPVSEPQEIWRPLRAAVERGKLARFASTSMASIKRGFRRPVRRRPPTSRLVLVSAVLIAAVLLVQWSASSDSWLGSLLSELGLAQTHSSGNPDVRVWIDANTGLYYCPGSGLYGKTPGGYFARQRAAEREQIESATRTPCW